MNAATLSARPLQSLKALDPARMQATDAALQLLAAQAGSARVAANGDVPDVTAFVVDDRTAFTVISDAIPMPPDQPDVDRACAALDAADALLGHVEGALDIKLDPVATAPASNSAFADPEALLLHLSDDRLTLTLAIVPDAEQTAAWVDSAKTVPVDPATVPVALSVEFEAAKLAVADAGAIGGGDLLLLPRQANASWRAASSAGAAQIAAIDLATMRLGAGTPNYDEEDSGMDEDDGPDTQGGFTVPVTVRLPLQHVTAAKLAGLQAGGSLDLGPLTQGLAVELLVGGRRIASGEIVEIGDRFAVLIDERAPSASNEEDV